MKLWKLTLAGIFMIVTQNMIADNSYETFIANNAHEAVFAYIFHNNAWHDSESVSGTGSSLKQTKIIRKEIPTVLQMVSAKSLLDAPCGDFNWMKEVNLSTLDSYIGADIVHKLIEQNIHRYSNNKRSFKIINIISDELPQVDVILCRDCLVHFSFSDIASTIKNFKRSKSRFLLTTTFSNPSRTNKNIITGDWRSLNLQLPPFNFPEPLYIINEECTEKGYPDKCLALWDLSALSFP